MDLSGLHFGPALNVAVSLDPKAGSPLSSDGEAGKIDVGPADESSRPMLEYVGKHYLRIGDSDKYYLMAGNQHPRKISWAISSSTTPSPMAATWSLPHADQLHHYDPDGEVLEAGRSDLARRKKARESSARSTISSAKAFNTQFMPTMNDYSPGFDTNPWIAL